jgi:DNA-binding response OmpR family regulator
LNQTLSKSVSKETDPGVVALFNASDDTIDMVQKMLTELDDGQRLIWCHFADLKKGVVDFRKYITKHNPEIVVFDISPPYDENWAYFKRMRDDTRMVGRGVVLTTTNKQRLDEVLGSDSFALEVVGRPADLKAIKAAIRAEALKTENARASVRQLGD